MHVFPELIGEMAKRGIKQTTIAHMLGITPRTLYGKLSGETDFKLSEVNRIHECYFPDLDKDILFRKVSESNPT